jgi:hypothetical protein
VLLNRLPLHLVVGVGVALAGIRADLGRARAGLPSHTGIPALSNRTSSTLRLQDSSWSQVRVEVRVGSNTSCDALGSLGVHVLQHGQEWAVQFDDSVICWRREQSPGTAASPWAAWNRVQLADGENRAVTL